MSVSLSFAYTVIATEGTLIYPGEEPWEDGFLFGPFIPGGVQLEVLGEFIDVYHIAFSNEVLSEDATTTSNVLVDGWVSYKNVNLLSDKKKGTLKLSENFGYMRTEQCCKVFTNFRLKEEPIVVVYKQYPFFVIETRVGLVKIKYKQVLGWVERNLVYTNVSP
jgi:hypothetical protein